MAKDARRAWLVIKMLKVCTYRAAVPSSPHAMLPTESIVFLFDGFEHKRRRVYRLLDGGQLSVLLKMDPAVRAQQDVLAAPVVPVLGGCKHELGSAEYNLANITVTQRSKESHLGLAWVLNSHLTDTLTAHFTCQY